ncbi:MAG: ABC transporter substrate-binding protein, partial [Bdellovibrionia bacterium]
MKTAMRFVILLLLFCPILGCTKSEIPDQHTLTVALSAAPATLDPRRTTDATGQRITSLIFNSLVRTGPDLRLAGDAADSWTYKDLKYTFNLKPGLTFSNGRRLTKEDVLYTFEEYKKAGGSFTSTLEPVKSVEVTESPDGALTIILNLSKFHAPLLDDLSAIKLLPKTEIVADSEAFARAPIGTGSYVLKKQDAQSIALEARENHPILAPRIKNLIFKVIQDDSTRHLKVLKGGIDIAQQELPLNKIAEFEKNSEFRVVKFPGLSMNYILVNFKN